MSIHYTNIFNESNSVELYAKSASLDYAQANGFALFPCAAGTKRPILPWKEGSTTDRKQWVRWAAEGHNLAIDCAKSGLIVVDVDASKVTREEAWQAYSDLCLSWGLASPRAAMTQSARGGWHCPFKRPEGVAATDLRGGGTLVKVSDIRALADGEKDGEVIGFKNRGYCVAPGSHFDGKQYLLMPDAPTPHAAPDALIELIRLPVIERKQHSVGRYCLDDTKALYKWLLDNGAIATDADWCESGMVARREFGDAGLEVWETLCREPGGLNDESLVRWESFDTPETQSNRNPVGLGTLLDRAHKMGWTGRVRDSVAWTFRNVIEKLPDGTYRVREPSPPSPEEMAMFAEDMRAGRIPLPSTWQGETEEFEARRSLRDRRVNAASLAGELVPERQWLVPGWIPMEQVKLLYGDGAVGKSLAALQLCVSAGAHWFGLPVKQGPVEFITAEDSDGELHRRLADISRETKQPLENMKYLNVSSFADEDAIMAALNGDGQLVKTAFYDEVLEVVQDAKPVLLVLDTLADIYGGNEVVRAQARAFVNMLRKIAIAHNLAVVVLAHPSIDGMRTGKGTSGSTGWSNSVRSRLYLDRVYDDQGMEPDTDARVLRSMKMNYGSVGNEVRMRWRAGIFVPERGGYSGGDPLVTAAKAERVFLELLAQARANNINVHATTGRGYAPDMFKTDAIKQGVTKRALEEAMRRLMNESKKIENVRYGAPSRETFRLQIVGGA
jgi:RecA-family ATPase